MARVTLPLDRGKLAAPLPEVCVVTGEPADQELTETFRWRPNWVILLIFLNILIFVIVALFVTKKVTLQLPVIESQQNYFTTRQRWRTLLILAALGNLIAGIALAIVIDTPGARPVIRPGFLILLSLGGLLFFLLLAAVYHDSGIVATSITNEEITLKNVHLNFAAAWEKMASDEPEEDE